MCINVFTLKEVIIYFSDLVEEWKASFGHSLLQGQTIV
jgi:hypothetical protein